MIKFPSDLLAPLKSYLEERKKETEKKLADLEAEDPFSDTERLIDNAASDTDVKEQASHQRVEAIRTEVGKNLVRIKKTLTKIGLGKYGICEKCKVMIDTERLAAMPTAELCIECAKTEENEQVEF